MPHYGGGDGGGVVVGMWVVDGGPGGEGWGTEGHKKESTVIGCRRVDLGQGVME